MSQLKYFFKAVKFLLPSVLAAFASHHSVKYSPDPLISTKVMAHKDGFGMSKVTCCCQHSSALTKTVMSTEDVWGAAEVP